MKCIECPDFHTYSLVGGDYGVCGVCDGGISWSKYEEIECPFKEVDE